MGRKIFRCWDTTNNFFQSLLLLAFRFYWGFLFFIGGVFKLGNMASFAAFFNQLGLSTGVAYLVAIFELVCGLLLFFGFLSRLAAACTTVIMFSAYILAHPVNFHAFFNNPQLFFSAPSFSFLVASLIVLFFGPGLFSIDALIKRKLMKEDEDNCCGQDCHSDSKCCNPKETKPAAHEHHPKDDPSHEEKDEEDKK